MSYEYEEINRAIVQQNGIDNNINRANLLQELDEVYALAEKFPEYEAKAKAFDHIENLVRTELTSDDLYNDARDNDYVAGMLRVYEMVDYIIEKYESGELE